MLLENKVALVTGSTSGARRSKSSSTSDRTICRARRDCKRDCIPVKQLGFLCSWRKLYGRWRLYLYIIIPHLKILEETLPMYRLFTIGSVSSVFYSLCQKMSFPCCRN